MKSDQFKAGLRWLAENSPLEFQAALDELVIFGSTAVLERTDGTFMHAPITAVMRLEEVNAKTTH